MSKQKKFIILLLVILAAVGLFARQWLNNNRKILTIYDYETKEVYVTYPVKVGDKLFVGWVHSWEKIPWHEYYHITAENDIVLDTIAFPSFGAGIPENKGKKVYFKDHMIYMDEIGQVFHEFTWINSHFAFREVRLNGELVTRGLDLPEHTRLNLDVRNRGLFDGREQK